MLVRFAPGLRPVLKADRSAAGRKAALARWGNRGGGSDAAETVLSRVGIGRSLDVSLIEGGEGSDGHHGPASLAKVVKEQGWDQPSQQVSEEEFAALAKDGRFTVVYRGGPGGLEQGMVDGTPFIGDGAYGPGTYVTKDIKRAAWHMPGKDMVTEENAAIVPMLVPRQITESAPKGSKTVAFDPVRDHAIQGADAINSANWRDDYVIYNTGAVIVGPPITGLSYNDFPMMGPMSDAAQARVDALTKAAVETSWWALIDGEAVPLAVSDSGVIDSVLKGSRSDAARIAANARWNQNRGLGIDRADMPQIPKKNRDKFFAQLKAEGVKYQDETVDPRSLKQTQSGLNPKQTKPLLDAMRDGTFRGATHTIIAARDGHILDGHHRWDAARQFAAEGGKADIKITRVDMSIRDLLDRAAKFNTEEGIEARTMETVSEYQKAVTIAFDPGLRPVLKGSRSEAARYAASVRWRDAKATASATRAVMTTPRRTSVAELIDERNEAFYRAIRYNDFSGYNIGSSKLARRIGKTLGSIDRKLDQFKERKGWTKKVGPTPDEARRLREDYDRRYRPWMT